MTDISATYALLDITMHFSTTADAATRIASDLGCTKQSANAWLKGDRYPREEYVQKLCQLAQDLDDEVMNTSGDPWPSGQRQATRKKVTRKSAASKRQAARKMAAQKNGDSVDEIEELKRAVVKLEKKLKAKLEQKKAREQYRLAVSEKGAVSLYGMRRRFPITLYAEEWKKALSMRRKILDFIQEHDDELS